RLLSLDAYRGLVLLLLVPDVYGGFSFYEMAKRYPDHTVWNALARAFTHVPWSGCSLWGLLLPSFLFITGVSIPYSYAARKRDGHSDARILTHAVLRALALLLLGILVQIPIRSTADMLWPLVLLAFGLPVSRVASAVFSDRTPAHRETIDTLWRVAILFVSAVHLFRDFDR